MSMEKSSVLDLDQHGGQHRCPHGLVTRNDHGEHQEHLSYLGHQGKDELINIQIRRYDR